MQVFERARPLLGTQVAIKVGGLSEAAAHAAIDAGFSTVAAVHQLMSFHEAESDISTLNRDAARGPVAVSAHTYAVISCALEMAAASGGVYDVTVAAQLVAWGYLPRPPGTQPDAEPDPAASWRDIHLLGDGRIQFQRPLWIDLGGIAKGYAVDAAVQTIMTTAPQCSVNAGGDLRASGPASERVLLRTDAPGDTVPVLEIENGSLASSSGREQTRRHGGRTVGPHLHGLRRSSVGTRSFVSVVAERCMIADALTKVVLAQGADAAPLLRAHGATAYLHDDRGVWQVVGTENGGTG